MDDLEIKIALTYKVPKNNLTLNGLLLGLERDRDKIMRNLLVVLFQALEEKAKEEYSRSGCVRDGHQSNHRLLRTSFGEIRCRLAQMKDLSGKIFGPLAKRLRFEPYRQYQRESLEAAVGQAIHLSYRLDAGETQRIKGQGPSKSTLWRRLQELAETEGAWPPMKHRPFQFLMVDGTKVHLQAGGYSLGISELRWAWAAERVGQPFELIGFWVGKDWSAIRRDLDGHLNYRRLRMLFSDSGSGIEESLRSATMDYQRCLVHGKHDFRFLFYADHVKGKKQESFLHLLDQNPLFHLRQADLEALRPEDEPLVRRLVRTIRRGFRELMAALPADKYPKTRTYLENFSHQALAFFDYWLDHQLWVPSTTNIAESGFSRVVNRIKRVGRRWSERGLLNWLRIAFRKIFQPDQWTALWKQYLRLHRRLRLVSLRSEYRWVNAIT
jgi:hypothetical protein